MSIPLTCPSCSTTYRVPADKAGKRTQCRQCQETLTVPFTVLSSPVVKPTLICASCGGLTAYHPEAIAQQITCRDCGDWIDVPPPKSLPGTQAKDVDEQADDAVPPPAPPSQWFYLKGPTKHGPVPLESLRGLVLTGELSPADLVWKKGMDEWVAAASITALQRPHTVPGMTFFATWDRRILLWTGGLASAVVCLLVAWLCLKSPTPEQLRERLQTRLPAGWNSVSVRNWELAGHALYRVNASTTLNLGSTYVFECDYYRGDGLFSVGVRHQGVPHPLNPSLDAIAMSISYAPNGEEMNRKVSPGYEHHGYRLADRAKELRNILKSSL